LSCCLFGGGVLARCGVFAQKAEKDTLAAMQVCEACSHSYTILYGRTSIAELLEGLQHE
jgi:hypothetical protein